MSRGSEPPRAISAEVVVPGDDLQPVLDLFLERLGFRIEAIFPADKPREAIVSGAGLELRLTCGAGAPPAVAASARARRVTLEAADGATAGRAGMLYRDLIPGRLGGRFIASHIRLPKGGPVADWVHFHEVAFQVIFCRRGCARLVYEDQGEPFDFVAGDCILQPPRIRHRVLETGAGFEVVEVSSPAEHVTLADHDLPLPTRAVDPARDFSGQRFVHDRAGAAVWRHAGRVSWRDTGLAAASGGLVGVQVAKLDPGARLDMAGHGGELLLGLLLGGGAVLDEDQALTGADALVIPPGEPWRLSAAPSGAEILLVTAPAMDQIGEAEEGEPRRADDP